MIPSEKSTLTKSKEWISNNFTLVFLFILIMSLLLFGAYNTRLVPNTQYTYKNGTITNTTILYPPNKEVPNTSFSPWLAFFIMFLIFVFAKVVYSKGEEPQPLDFEMAKKYVLDWWKKYYPDRSEIDVMWGKLQKSRIGASDAKPKRFWIEAVYKKGDLSVFMMIGLHPYSGKIEVTAKLESYMTFSDFVCPRCGKELYNDERVIDDTLYGVWEKMFGGKNR